MTPIKDSLMNFGAGLVLEHPARKLSLDQHAARLEASRLEIEARLQSVSNSPRNAALLSHITGIEHWGRRRLQVATGAPLLLDEYDGYRPPGERSWSELQADFHTARLETIELARCLASDPPPEGLKIPHNQFGPLSVRGWLRYLDMHAQGEAKKMR